MSVLLNLAPLCSYLRACPPVYEGGDSNPYDGSLPGPLTMQEWRLALGGDSTRLCWSRLKSTTTSHLSNQIQDSNPSMCLGRYRQRAALPFCTPHLMHGTKDEIQGSRRTSPGPRIPSFFCPAVSLTSFASCRPVGTLLLLACPKVLVLAT